MNQSELFEAVVEVAMEMDMTDPTDFGMLQLSEESAYRFIASQLNVKPDTLKLLKVYI